MKNGVCPKCNGRDVYHQTGNIHQREQVTLSGTVFSHTTPPDRYVCASCGYVEFYIASDDHLQIVREKWQKVGS